MKIEELLIENLDKAMAEFSKVAGPKQAKLKIDKFVELKNKNQFKDPIERDINHWRRLGWEEFNKVIDMKTSIGTDTQRKRGKIVGNAIMLRDDAEWKVLIPLDKEASVFYGKGTKWCTTRPQDSYYENYVYRDNGTLIYAIDQVGNGKRSVAILIKSNGDIDRFNKEDAPIENAEYTKVSGLDPTKFIKQAQLPENKAQTDKAREIYHKARKDTEQLLAVRPINVDAIEILLKITKHSEDCYRYIIEHSKEQKKRVSVHPSIVAAAAVYVAGKTTSKSLSTNLGEHIDFSKIPNATMKSSLRMSPELFIHNIDLLSDEQQLLLTSSPKSAYLYVMSIHDEKPLPAVEPVIATDAEYAVKYATNVLKKNSPTSGRFPAGEPEIATSAEWSIKYATDVLGGKPFPAGEPEIATSAEWSYRYAKDALGGKPFPAGEPEIVTSANWSYKYAADVLKRPFPKGESAIYTDSDRSLWYAQEVLRDYQSRSWEQLIKNDPRRSFEYASVRKNPFPLGEKAIATSEHYSIQYAIEILGKKPFPLGEKAIATSAPYSYAYANEVLKNNRFPAGEAAIASNGAYAYLYAKKVLKRPFPEGEEAIMNSQYEERYREFLSTVAPRINRDNRNQQVAGKVAFPILPPNVVKTTEYFMGNYDDEPKGPFSSSDIFRLMKMHHIKPDEKLIWRKGLTNWITLAELLPELDPTNYKRKNQPADNQVTKSKTSPEFQYFIGVNKNPSPQSFPSSKILEFLKTNLIPDDALLWRNGLDEWTPISELMQELNSVKTEGRYTQRRNINAYNIKRYRTMF